MRRMGHTRSGCDSGSYATPKPRKTPRRASRTALFQGLRRRIQRGSSWESIRDDANAHPSDRINAVKGLAALRAGAPWSVSVGTARRPEEQPVALPRCCPPRRHPASALRSRARPGIRNPKVDGCEHHDWVRTTHLLGAVHAARLLGARARPERLPGGGTPLRERDSDARDSGATGHTRMPRRFRNRGQDPRTSRATPSRMMPRWVVLVECPRGG